MKTGELTKQLEAVESEDKRVTRTAHPPVSEAAHVDDRLRVGWLNGGRRALGGVHREQKMLKGHLTRVIYITKYTNIRRQSRGSNLRQMKLWDGPVSPFFFITRKPRVE